MTIAQRGTHVHTSKYEQKYIIYQAKNGSWPLEASRAEVTGPGSRVLRQVYGWAPHHHGPLGPCHHGHTGPGRHGHAGLGHQGYLEPCHYGGHVNPRHTTRKDKTSMLFPSWTHCHGHKGKESSNFQADVKQAHTIITFEIELLHTVFYTFKGLCVFLLQHRWR